MTSGYGVTKEGLFRQINQSIIKEIIKCPGKKRNKRKKYHDYVTELIKEILFCEKEEDFVTKYIYVAEKIRKEEEEREKYIFISTEISSLFIEIIKSTMREKYSNLERMMELMRYIAGEVTRRKLPFIVSISESSKEDKFIFLQLYQRLKIEKVSMRLQHFKFSNKNRHESILRVD
jgi:hypothetical protein